MFYRGQPASAFCWTAGQPTVFILGVLFTPKINAQAGQGARTGAAMEAARLVTGGGLAGCLRLFCKQHDKRRKERAATLLQVLSYEVTNLPISTLVAWRLGLRIFLQAM